jgi:hypothetical protein
LSKDVQIALKDTCITLLKEMQKGIINLLEEFLISLQQDHHNQFQELRLYQHKQYHHKSQKKRIKSSVWARSKVQFGQG